MGEKGYNNLNFPYRGGTNSRTSGPFEPSPLYRTRESDEGLGGLR